ncbi:MAG: hypothetical protein WC966_06895 [Bradymonadales bacterium]|jgi:serine/threonine protein kinase
MPLCPVCSLTGAKLGARCQCDDAYLVSDNFRRDPANYIGQLVAGKYVPIDTLYFDERLTHYEALQKPMDRRAQLYLLAPQYAKNNDVVQRLTQCAARLAAINHPSLLAVYESFNDQNFTGVSIEDTRSYRLSKEAPFNGIDEVSLMHIIHQILQAMAQLHHNKLLLPHISPENVLILRTSDDPYSVKVTGVINAYLHDSVLNANPASDVFELGKMLLYLITGSTRPNAPLPPYRARIASIMPLILRATRNDEQRYSSAIEFLHDFENLLELNKSPHPRPSLQTPVSSQRPKSIRETETIDVVWMHKGS